MELKQSLFHVYLGIFLRVAKELAQIPWPANGGIRVQTQLTAEPANPSAECEEPSWDVCILSLSLALHGRCSHPMSSPWHEAWLSLASLGKFQLMLAGGLVSRLELRSACLGACALCPTSKEDPLCL